MHLLPDIVRVRDLPAAEWLMSASFVSRRWQSKTVMVMVWPIYLLTLISAVVLGGAYWRERNGLVLVQRWRPFADVVVLLVVLVVIMTVGGLLVSLWGWVWLVTAVCALWFCAGLVVAMLCNGNGSGSAIATVGRDTPKGQRWVIGGLAQRPGTRLTAVFLARDLVTRLPSGAVLLGVAADDELLRHYLRLGFTLGRGRRVYLRITD